MLLSLQNMQINAFLKLEGERDMENRDNVKEKEDKGIAMELLGELQNTIRKQWILIVILIILLAGTNIYHIYQWSQFETVVVDSGDGGNAGYIGNDGDVNNYGEGSSPQKEKSEKGTETKGQN